MSPTVGVWGVKVGGSGLRGFDEVFRGPYRGSIEALEGLYKGFRKACFHSCLANYKPQFSV